MHATLIMNVTAFATNYRRLPKFYHDLIKYKQEYGAGDRVHIFNALRIINLQNHLAADGLHLSMDGSAVLMQNIYQAIDSIRRNVSHPCLTIEQ